MEFERKVSLQLKFLSIAVGALAVYCTVHISLWGVGV